MTSLRVVTRSSVLLEHDLFRRPVGTPDHRVRFFKIRLLRTDDDTAGRT